MASFDENGKYIKTDWKAGDKITATKLNKIEESIEAVNDNDISRHVEADARLDALEAKDVAHDKELTNIKNAIADNKAAAELGDYDINSRMTFLERELNEGIAEVNDVASTVDGKIATAVANVNNVANTVDGKINAAITNVNNVANTVDGKIATAEANMAAQVNQGKADMEAMVAEVDTEVTEIQNDVLKIQKDVLEIQNEYTTCDFTHNDFYGSVILNNGFTLKWGRLEFGPNYTVDNTIDYIFTFPEPFTIGVWMLNYSLAGGDNGWDGICSGYPIDRTQTRLVVRGINPTITNSVYWLAIGM